MKNILRFLFLFSVLLLSVASSYGQSTSCSTAVEVEHTTECVPQDYAVTNGSLWTYVVADTQEMNIRFSTPVSAADTPVAELKVVNVYSGKCNNLTLIATDTFSHGATLPQTVYVGGLTTGDTCFVEVQAYYSPTAGCRVCQKQTTYIGICAAISVMAEPCITTDEGTFCCILPADCQYLITACVGENINFAVSLLNILQGGTATWTLTGSNCTSPQTVAIQNSINCTYSTPGQYYASVILVYTNGDVAYSAPIGITILPVPSASFTAPSVACVNEPVCISSTSSPNAPTGLNIDFGDGNSSSFCVGSPVPLCDTVICHTYALPGTYTVCLTNDNGGCVDTVCQTITIESLNAMFSADTVCVGQPTTFSNLSTCTGANITPPTYLWNFGDNATSSLQNPQHTYASVGTYSVTLTVTDNGNQVQDTYSTNVVVLAAPLFSITSTNNQYNTACGSEQYCISPTQVGQTYSITAYDYSWNQLQTGTSCVSINWATFNYTGGYIVASATNQQSCTTYDTLTVLPCCSSGNLITLYNDSTSNRFGNGPTTINGGTYYLNGQLIVNTVVNLTNVTLQMGPNAQILIRQSQYGSAQLNMDKCYVWSGCGIMWDGIYVEGNTSASLDFKQCVMEDATNGIVSLNGGTYNIQQATMNRNLVSVTVMPFTGTHPGRIVSSTFECVNSLNPNNANNATLLTPNQGAKSNYGVYSMGTGTQQGTLTVGDATVASYKNIFTMGLKNGIYTKNVNLNVYNNEFSYISITPSSKAIWAVGRYITIFPMNLNTYTVNVGGSAANQRNLFTNCKYGVYVDVCMKGQISYNKFEYIPVLFNTVMSGTAITYNNTTMGFSQAMTIERDSIINATIGITGSNNTNCNTTIKDCYIATNVSTLNTAIGVRLSGNLSSNGLYTVYNNVMTNVRYGVYALGLKNVRIDGNRITVKPYGITRGISVINNVQAKVTSNIIDASSPNAQTNQNVGGVFVSNSSSSVLTCNDISDIHHSIKFEGTGSNAAAVYRNRLYDGTHGYWLHGGPVLGNQGTTTYPSDNTWNGSFMNDTYMSTGPNNTATFGNNSKIYHRSSPSQYVPTPNSNGAGSLPMQPQSLSGSFAYKPCYYPMPVGWGHKAKLMVVNDEINTETTEGNWMSVHSVYRDLIAGWDTLLTEDSTLIKNDSLFIAFKDSVDATVTGSLEAMINAINSPDAVDYDSLIAVCQSLAPSNELETNFQTVTEIALSARSSGVPINETDLTTLRDIAILCPYTDGVGVFIARSILAQYDTAGTEYINPCEEAEDTTGGNRIAMYSAQQAFNGFSVHPNPAQNSVTVEYVLNEGEQGTIEIYSITGSIVASYQLLKGETALHVGLGQLNAGLYFYRINVNSVTVVSDKLIIIK